MTYARDARVRELAAAFGGDQAEQNAAIAETALAAGQAVAGAISAQRAAGKTPEDFEAVGDGDADDTAALGEWALSGGRLRLTDGAIYRVTAPIAVNAKRIDATGGTILFDPAAPTEQAVILLADPSSRWVGGEIDANLKAAIGIDAVSGCRITGVEIHGVRSTAGGAHCIRITGPNGGTVSNCDLYDAFSLGNGSTGDANGAARGVYCLTTVAPTKPFIVTDNTIQDILGEEGDGIQIIAYSGAYPFLDTRASRIERNRIVNCSRRSIKIQANNLNVSDNDIFENGVATELAMSAIDLIASQYVTVSRNRVRCSTGWRGISASKTSVITEMLGIRITDNDVLVQNADFMAIYVDGATGAVIANNRPVGGLHGIAVGNSTQTAIQGNTFSRSVLNGTNADIHVTADCSRMVIEDNVGLDGAKFSVVNCDAPLSVLRRNVNVRAAGYAVVYGSPAIGVLTGGNVNANSTENPVLGNESVGMHGSNVNLGDRAVSAGGAPIIFVSGDPTTTRATRYHKRGTIAFNQGAGSEVGWRCTGFGTPGTWVAFS